MPPSSPRETREDDENAIPLMVHSKNIASDVRSHHRVATTHHNETAGDTPSRPQNNSSPAPGLLRKWWTEFVCCVLVMGALLAIVATVYPYSGSPLPQWPYGLSINTLIAIYVTTLKAAMLFVVAQGLSQLKWDWFEHTRPLLDLAKYDDASRGSWGAMNLLWWLGRRNTFVTSLGAMVTILAVVVDPFVQQIAHYYTCAQVAHSYEAFIPRVNSYQDNEAVRQGAGIQTLGAGTQAAISAGSFSASAFNLPFICPTGNCTFQTPYLSVGYCSSCSDISTELRTVNYTYLSNNSAGINVPEWQLNYTLPSGLYLVADGATLAVGGYYNNSDSPLAPIAIVEVMYEAPQLSGAIRNCTQDDPCTPDDTWVRRGYGAARCEIGACVKEYAATVQSGILHETLSSSSSKWGAVEHGYISTVDMDCVTDAQKALLRGLGYKFQDTTRWLAYNVSVVTIGPGQGNIHGGAPAGPGLAYFSDYSLNYTNVTQSIVPPQCIYSYDWLSANALAKWLAGYFDGAVEVAPAAGLFTTGLDEHASLTTASSALLLELYDGGRASLLRTSEIFTNITYSITTYIRQNGITHLSSPAVGLATHNETCVRIQWAWLTFPAVLVIMTLFFFVAMISGTRRTGHEVNNHDFKGSVLPLMFHGLYEDGPDSFGGTIGTLGQMSRDAKHVLVALSPTDRGWRFTEMNREKRHK